MRTLKAIDWGSVPDWVAGVGSLGAIVIALWVALGESRIRRRRDEDEDRRLARLVVVGEPVFWSSATGDSTVDQVIVGVMNYGDAPIHDLEMGLDIEGIPETTWQMMQFLGPGEKDEFIYDLPANGSAETSVDAPQLWFVDGGGRRWKRSTGDLEPERVVDFITHTLPEPFRAEIQRNIAQARRGRRRGKKEPRLD